MRCCRWLLHSFLVCLVVIGPSGNAEAQSVKIRVKTLRCGRSYVPDYLSVSIFDDSKVPQITKSAKDLATALVLTNTDPDSIDKAEALYEQLLNLVAATPALTRSKNLRASEYLFAIPFVKRVFVFGSGMEEDNSFTYTSKELTVSSEHINSAILDFTKGPECKAPN
jgi:hypothetical protein